MRGGKAGIELDGLVEGRYRAIGAVRVHASKAESKAGIRVADIERDRTLGQLE